MVLAGDLAPYTDGLAEHLAEYWSTAPYILYVRGNHEFYGTEIDDTRAKLAEECAKARIHLRDSSMIRVAVRIMIGAGRGNNRPNDSRPSSNDGDKTPSGTRSKTGDSVREDRHPSMRSVHDDWPAGGGYSQHIRQIDFSRYVESNGFRST